MDNLRPFCVHKDSWLPAPAGERSNASERSRTARGRFSALGVPWEIRADDVSAFHLLLDRLPPGSTPTRGKDIARHYSLRTLPPSLAETEPRYLLEADGRPRLNTSDLSEIAGVFEANVRCLVAERSPRTVFLRAGVVGWRHRTIVIPGGPGSGKSTLVRALVASGATYFSEEYAVLQGGIVLPYPSRQVTRPLPPVSLGTWVEEGPQPPTPLPVGLVLFAPYQSGAVFIPKMVSPGRLLLGLFKHAVASQRAPERVLRTLEAVLRRCNGLEGLHGDAESVASYLLDHLA